MYYGYLILEIIIVAKYNKITFKPPPPPPQESPIPPVGEYGYFLKLHIKEIYV